MLLIVAQGLVGIGQRALLDLFIFISVDQVPINILDSRNRSDDLRLEGKVGDLEVLLRNANIALVGAEAKTRQQRLRDISLPGKRNRGVHDLKRAIGGHPLAGETPLKFRAGGEIFGVLRGVANRVRLQESNALHNRIQLLRLGVIHEALEGEHGIERIHECSFAQGRLHQAARSGRRGSGGNCSSSTGRRPSNGSQWTGDVCAGAIDQATGLGAGKISQRCRQVIAERSQVEVVLNCQRNRIIQGDIDLSVADEVSQARRIAEVQGRHSAGAIGRDRVTRMRQLDVKWFRRCNCLLLQLLRLLRQRRGRRATCSG